jgi:phosphoribosylpyrophosphate synthetase
MNINTNFGISSSDATQGRVSKISKDPQQENKGQSESSQIKAVVVAPDEQGTSNAKAYQDFIKEDSNAYSQQAIASYQSFEKQQQRESIQDMFGVDIYA